MLLWPLRASKGGGVLCFSFGFIIRYFSWGFGFLFFLFFACLCFFAFFFQLAPKPFLCFFLFCAFCFPLPSVLFFFSFFCFSFPLASGFPFSFLLAKPAQLIPHLFSFF